MPHTAPVRTCVACRRQRPKHELLRVAATPSGVRADPEGRLPGRGAYICPDPSCVDHAARREGRVVRRALRDVPAEQVHAALRELQILVRPPAPDERQPDRPPALKEPST